jgi:hypothetical protein
MDTDFKEQGNKVAKDGVILQDAEMVAVRKYFLPPRFAQSAEQNGERFPRRIHALNP